MEFKVMKNIMGASQAKADEVRDLLARNKVLMLNLIGSPGCGKTTILERTLEDLAGKVRFAIIEGDVATDRDARRLEKFNIPMVLINTDGACHLEPISVLKALEEFDLASIDVVIVENVGNLVCPAEFDIGEAYKIAVSSVTEGEEKPEKYPLLFSEAALLLLNKIDIAEVVGFNREAFDNAVSSVNSRIKTIDISSKTRLGMEEWYDWLIVELERIA